MVAITVMTMGVELMILPQSVCGRSAFTLSGSLIDMGRGGFEGCEQLRIVPREQANGFKLKAGVDSAGLEP